jgi:hypothetical protein
MRVTQDLSSFGEIIAHAQCSVDENIYIYIFRVYHIRIIAKKNGSDEVKIFNPKIPRYLPFTLLLD